jgi:hypothetical protein
MTDNTVNYPPSRAAFLSTISLFFNVLQLTTTQRYVVLLMIQALSQQAAFVLMFFVFYRILSNYLERMTTSTERPLLMDALHYLILGILAIISIVEAILLIVVLAQNVDQYYSHLISTYLNISASQEILYWLASLEMVGCGAVMMVKAGSLELRRQVSVAQFSSWTRADFKRTMPRADLHRFLSEVYSFML